MLWLRCVMTCKPPLHAMQCLSHVPTSRHSSEAEKAARDAPGAACASLEELPRQLNKEHPLGEQNIVAPCNARSPLLPLYLRLQLADAIRGGGTRGFGFKASLESAGRVV